MKFYIIMGVLFLLMVGLTCFKLNETYNALTTVNYDNSHAKLINRGYAYTVRSLCLDHKEYFFINGQSSVVLPNTESGITKYCDY